MKYRFTLSHKILFALMFALLLAAGMFRARYGISFSDEGIYLSQPFRIALAGATHRDEIRTLGFCRLVILIPLMKILPNYGSVLMLRYIGLIFHFICLLFFVCAFIGLAPQLVLGSVFAATAFANVFSIWTPNYNQLHTDFFLLALALLISGMRGKKSGKAAAACGTAAGAAFILGALCYQPVAALIPVPFFASVFFFMKFGKKDSRFISSAALTVSASVFAVALVVVLVASGASGDYIEALKDMSSTAAYSISIIEKFKEIALLLNMLLTPQFTFCHLLFWWVSAAMILKFKKAGDSGSIPLSLKTVLFIVIILYTFTLYWIFLWPLIEALCLLSIMSWLYLTMTKKNRMDEETSSIFWILIVFGSLWQLIMGRYSTNSISVSTFNFACFYVALAIPVYYQIEIFSAGKLNGENARKWAAAVVSGLSIAIAVNITGSSFAHSYMDDNVRNMTAKFTHGRLKGIYSTPERVKEVETTLNYLDSVMAPGEYLLAYENIPIMYYLSGMAPAVDSVNLNKKLWKNATLNKFLKRMIDDGKTPRYALRLLIEPESIGRPIFNDTFARSDWLKPLLHPEKDERPPSPTPMIFYHDPERDPVNSFVVKYYVPVARFGYFEVWRSKADIRKAISGT